MKTFLDFHGSEIHYRVSGEGAALVLLHGFLEDMSMWNDFAGQLSKKYRVVTIDFPGFGASECLDISHNMDTFAEVVDAVLSQLEIKQCVMLGHSMGGYAALSFAAMYPEKLKGLCLFHSHALADTDEAKQNRERVIAVIKSDKCGFIFSFFPDLFAPENVENFQQDIDDMHEVAMKASQQGIILALDGMKNRPSSLDVLINAPWPVLFVLGKKDSRIPFQTTLAQAALPPRGEILMLDNVGHMGHIEARDYTLKTVEGFVAKCS
jgi:pimeloyl-ACP methyl ester carboxylesterase